MRNFRVIIRAVLAYFLVNITAYLYVDFQFLFLLFLLLVVIYLVILDVFIDVTVFFLLVIVFFLSFSQFSSNEKEQINEKVANEVVCIVAEVDVRKDHVKYTVESDAIGRFLIKFSLYPRFEYGDCLIFNGNIKEASVNEDFDYREYLKRFGIYGISYDPKLELISQNGGFFSFIFSIKQKFDYALKKIYLEPDSSLVAGLLLGSRGGLGQELMDKFNAIGLTHIIAVSGSNVATLIIFVNFLFSFLQKRWRMFLSICSIIFFVIIAGMSASVIRAGIMGVISILVLWGGKSYFTGFALFYSAFLMLSFDPYVLIYDLGFQLSFLSSIGVIYFVPKIEAYFRFLPSKFGIRESFLLSLASQITTLPLILFAFGRVSIISVLANLFVLPFVPIIMLLGFLSIFVLIFSKSLAVFLASLNHYLIKFILLIVDFFAGFQFASIEVEKISTLTMLLIYLFLYFWLFHKNFAKFFRV